MLIEEQDWRKAAAVDPDGPRPAQPALAVGIGAGDGALEALKALFIAIEDSAAMAFVVVQRGDRGAGSLVELLEQFTELAVREVHDGDLLEPDRVYVAPIGHAVEIQSNRFALSPRLEPGAEHIAIDTLFRSLARGFGTRAVGIVLSGAGADGSQGVQAIARAGGLTLAADPERAPCPSMPKNAVASGVIDQVLSPFEMPEALLARSTAVALDELRQERAEQHGSVDDLTLANAELRRLNRELLAIHAKLHANVARLQTSIEALTARNQELADQHSNLCAMLSDGALAVLLLDDAEHVRAFSGQIQLIYALTASDIGKPLGALEHRAHDMPALPSLEELCADPRVREDDVVTRERWYLRRVLPQYGAYGDVEGLVVTFLDVTRLKESEAAARPHESWLRAITDAEPAIISFVDDALQTV